MRRRHAVSPGFSGHYQDLGIPNLKGHDSACNLIVSVALRVWQARVVFELTQMTKGGRAAAIKKLDSLRPAGRTNIWDGASRGWDDHIRST